MFYSSFYVVNCVFYIVCFILYHRPILFIYILPYILSIQLFGCHNYKWTFVLSCLATDAQIWPVTARGSHRLHFGEISSNGYKDIVFTQFFWVIPKLSDRPIKSGIEDLRSQKSGKCKWKRPQATIFNWEATIECQRCQYWQYVWQLIAKHCRTL